MILHADTDDFVPAAPDPGAPPVGDCRLKAAQGMGCLLISCAVPPEEAVHRLSDTVRVRFPLKPGTTDGSAQRRVLWLTPRSWLLLCPVPEEVALADAINESWPDRCAYAALYSDALRWIDLSGTGAQALLAEYTFISLDTDDLAPGRAKRLLVADTPTIVVRESENGWLLGVERSRARHVTDSLQSALRRSALLSRSG
jgi:heterotetrameric sarcosine oxidase gamma subunit